VGTALRAMREQGHEQELRALYERSAFFRALLDNCEMALLKCYFPLTAHLARHPKFGTLWNKIHDEFRLTEQQLLELTGKRVLMENEPVSRQSIAMRERIVLPLVTIQQYALVKHGMGAEDEYHALRDKLEKLITRCSFGIINAGRNSA